MHLSCSDFFTLASLCLVFSSAIMSSILESVFVRELCALSQERAKQAKQKRPTNMSKTKVIDLSKDGDEEGVLDNLLECLQSGSMFQNTRWAVSQVPLCLCIACDSVTSV